MNFFFVAYFLTEPMEMQALQKDCFGFLPILPNHHGFILFCRYYIIKLLL